MEITPWTWLLPVLCAAAYLVAERTLARPEEPPEPVPERVPTRGPVARD